MLRALVVLTLLPASATLAADLPTSAPAAEAAIPAPRNSSWSLGFELHRYQDDFGLGLVVSSPLFLRESSRITLRGGTSAYPYGLSAGGNQEWELWGDIGGYLESGYRVPRFPLRLYGFGGPVVVFTPSQLRSDLIAVGGEGGFGFEFFMPHAGDAGDGPVSYFIELGGVGTGVRADKIPARPSFGNGFLTRVGFRAYPVH
jgi:hypothetical protein